MSCEATNSGFKETAMKKILLSALVASLVFAGSAAYGMTADDIIQLCKAGFTPQRIAKIVDATGLDAPLVAADWARIRNDGCDDRVVDALLEVLVPADEATGEASDATMSDDSDESGETASNVNVYLRTGWGWDGWYGGFSYGWYDPYWSVGWTAWDPYWTWGGWGYPGYWWANDWWGYPYRHRFGCGPYFYHSNWYHGGYYASGHWERHKDYRRGRGEHGSYYSDHKTPETVQRGLMSKAVAYQMSSNSTDRAYGLRSKGSAVSPTSTITKGTGSDRGYTTRSKSTGKGLTTREQLRSKGTGTAIQGKTATGGSRYGTVKTQGKSGGTTPSGTGNQGTYRQRAKSSGGTTATPPATTTTKQKSTPPPAPASAPAGNEGGKGSIQRDGGSTGGSTQSTPKLKGKG